MGQPTSMVGSIGVYTTLIDPTGAYEKQGYKIHTIYSPTSSEKNKEWRAIFDNEDGKPDKSLLEARLAFLDKTFMKQVSDNRGPELNSKALEGGMFFAEQAIELGLADGMGSFQDALEAVINLSSKSQIITL
jgi:protease-4